MGRRAQRLSWLLIPALLGLAYLAWPYATLWRLDQALTAGNRESLARLVDLDAVRAEICRKLNKDAESALGPLSDGFIEWLEHGIRRNGTLALERQVTLDWVEERLLSHSPPGAGIRGVLSHAFFDGPRHLSLRIGPPDRTPVFARLSLYGMGWRISALHY